MVGWIGIDADISMMELELVEPNIFKNEDGFFYEDETGTDLCGPYPTIEEARRGLNLYCQFLSSPWG